MKKPWFLLIFLLLAGNLACSLTGSVISPTPQVDEAAPAAQTEPTSEQVAPQPASTSENKPVVQPPVSSGGLNPSQPVKLVFIHHSSGELWLRDDEGGLGAALRDNNYFVSDTNYDWGPNDPDLGGPIGSYTDIGNWWNWFLGPRSNTYMSALFAESAQHSEYSRLGADPGGQNTIVMFKSCFPNSDLEGEPNDAPVVQNNPLNGMDSGSEFKTIGNAKGVYVQLLSTFKAHPDKFFVLVTAPPLIPAETDARKAANARALSRWLVQEWLKGYPLKNIVVFDLYNVLTSNGGSNEKNDLDQTGGNHHRLRGGTLEYITTQGSDFAAYAAVDDSHPKAAGTQKATAEFIPLLNAAYKTWKNG